MPMMYNSVWAIIMLFDGVDSFHFQPCPRILVIGPVWIKISEILTGANEYWL